MIIGLAVAVVIGLLVIQSWPKKTTENGENDEIPTENGETNGKTTKDHPPIDKPIDDPKTKIIPGREVTREVMKTVFEGDFDDPPPAINDKARLKEIFEKNKKSQVSGLATFSGRASHKDWGIEGFADFTMATQSLAEVTIEENDGERITALVDVLELATLEFRAKPGIRINLGERAHALFMVGALALNTQGIIIPPGIPKAGESILNEILQHDLARELINEAGIMPISPPEIDRLKNTQFRVHYRDGGGVEKVVFIGYIEGQEPKDADQFPHLEDLHYLFQGGVFASAHLIPSGPLEDGDLFDVPASVLPTPFPSSWNMKKWGKISFGRYDESGNKGEIYYRRGTFQASGKPKNAEISAEFIPTEGTVEFQIKPQKLKMLKMKGDAALENTSSDHWIFEAEHQVTPKFEITYKVDEIND